MKFTILGGSGFIGSRLVQHLLDSGNDVYVPRKGSNEIFERDLGRVIYAIGLTADFRNRPYDTVEAHVCYLNKILQDACFSSITYLSSTRVYQGAKVGKENEELNILPNLDGLYNLTKLTGEALCLQSGRGQVARLSNIVGEGASESFLAQLISEAVTGSISLRSSLSSSKDYLLIQDAIKALEALTLHDGTGIYNIASGKNITTEQILSALSTRIKFTTSVMELAIEHTYPEIDVKSIGELINWEPQCVINWINETQSLH